MLLTKMAQAERASTVCPVPDVAAESAYVAGLSYCPQMGPVFGDSVQFHSSALGPEDAVTAWPCLAWAALPTSGAFTE